MIGFGNKEFKLAIYIANRPELDNYPDQATLIPLNPGEIDYIGKNTSNHWRKVFNVSAKFLFQLYSEHDQQQVEGFDNWQDYRDRTLFQAECQETLLFSAPQFTDNDVIHIVAGKTYAEQLGLQNLIWLDKYFAVSSNEHLIVCPYLDYRQLSNARIDTLVSLVQKLRNRGLAEGS